MPLEKRLRTYLSAVYRRERALGGAAPGGTRLAPFPGSPRLGTGDIVSWPRLCEEIKRQQQQQQNPGKRIWQQIGPAGQSAIDAIPTEVQEVQSAQELVREILRRLRFIKQRLEKLSSGDPQEPQLRRDQRRETDRLEQAERHEAARRDELDGCKTEFLKALNKALEKVSFYDAACFAGVPDVPAGALERLEHLKDSGASTEEIQRLNRLLLDKSCKDLIVENRAFLLDDLLGGGLVIPDGIIAGMGAPQGGPGPHRPLFMLLIGPPGSGKSTLALELCYRLATNPNPDIPGAERGLSSIYVSAESDTRALIQNAESFGWGVHPASPDWAPKRILPGRTVGSPRGYTLIQVEGGEDGEPRHLVSVFGRDAWKPQLSPWKAGEFFRSVGDLIRLILDGPAANPKIVVFDSLNVVPAKENPDTVLQSLIGRCPPSTILIVAMLETDVASKEHVYWPYLADVVINVGQDVQLEYITRTIQIVKARYQDHADGIHRLKINQRPPRDEGHPQGARPRREGAPFAMAPLIREGGIFVFPSIHRIVGNARAKLSDKTRRLAKPIPTPFRALNSIIQSQGFPESSCTAIVGSRGGMKSHLAYYTLLRFLKDNPNERALIISLRDDEDAAMATLAQIAANQRTEKQTTDDATPRALVDEIYGSMPQEQRDAIQLVQIPDSHADRLDQIAEHIERNIADDPRDLGDSRRASDELLARLDRFHQDLHKGRLVQARSVVRSELIDKERLEILFFWPGYIPPEEFFHLVMLAANREPNGRKPVSLVVVNGLEQLDARFPLCARERMFVSGLVTLLSANGVTSIVVSGGNPTRPPKRGGVQSGLLPMADLIIESSFQNLSSEAVWSKEVWADEWSKVSQNRPEPGKGKEPHVVYQVIRGPGARECRSRVLFYMGREGDRSPLFPGSVTVRSLPESFRPGKRL